ncbi:hypothetical protein ACFFJN_19945 [Erwinia mallotivora]|uniref:hypothetical protein n=1 Tax=Erwinia mallotivora TaxID=69222 RepID=UPI0035E59BF0
MAALIFIAPALTPILQPAEMNGKYFTVPFIPFSSAMTWANGLTGNHHLTVNLNYLPLLPAGLPARRG